MAYVVSNIGKKYNIMWYGFLAYAIIYAMSETIAGFPMAVAFFMLASLPTVFLILSNLSFDFSNRNKTTLAVYWVMLFWLAVMAARSNLELFYPTMYGILSYSGVALFAMKEKPLLCSLFQVGYKVNYLFFVIWILPLLLKDNGVTQMILETFPIPAAYILLTNKYQSNRNVVLSIVVLLVAFLVATLTARRNLMLTYGLYIMIGGIFMLVNGKIKSAESKIIMVFTASLLLVAAVTLYLNESSGMFSKITTRAGEDTREGVVMAFAADMLTSGTDVLVGRGMSGEYYCPGVEFIDRETNESLDYRFFIECGYLYLILKGGIIYLFLYVALFLIAIWQGFKSRNALCKASACIVLVQLVDMAPFGLHGFNTKMFMIWLALSVCLDKNFRKMTDEQVRDELFTIKNKLLPWQKK